jgi:hypothetical protein
VDNPATEVWGAFYSPPRESSIWSVRNPAKEPDKAGITWDKAERPAMFRLGADMSELALWKPNKEPDKAGITKDKAERPDMFGLGAGHVWLAPWNLDKETDKVG